MKCGISNALDRSENDLVNIKDREGYVLSTPDEEYELLEDENLDCEEYVLRSEVDINDSKSCDEGKTSSDSSAVIVTVTFRSLKLENNLYLLPLLYDTYFGLCYEKMKFVLSSFCIYCIPYTLDCLVFIRYTPPLDKPPQKAFGNR